MPVAFDGATTQAELSHDVLEPLKPVHDIVDLAPMPAPMINDAHARLVQPCGLPVQQLEVILMCS